MRYQWFDYKMHELNADVLLTAHHLDDQLETIFLPFVFWTGNTQSIRHVLSYGERAIQNMPTIATIS